MYIKAPTFLFHKTLAPRGRIFQGSAERPIPHPGEGWVDTPFPAGEADEASKSAVDAALKADAELKLAWDEIAGLREQLSDMRARAESAEASVEGAKGDLAKEQAAHRATKAKLEELSGENDRLHVKIEDQAKQLAELPELQADREALRRKKSGAL